MHRNQRFVGLQKALAVLLASLVLLGGEVHGQGRVAPGVPPQHYQQAPPQNYQPPPPQHQQQQQQMHHQQQFQQPLQQQQFQQPPPQQQQQFQQPQQAQFQQQQVPVQHQQVPVQHQQQPGGHHHGHHEGPPQVFNPGNIQHEKEHIAEHMEVPMDTSKMTDQELQFHYFKMHDADNNNKLDGCELIKSLIHWHEQGSKEPNAQNKVEDKLFKDDELVNLIDPILNMDDLNKDGYIDYPEFVRAQQKAAAGGTQQQAGGGQH